MPNSPALKSLVTDYYEAINTANWSALDELVLPGFAHHTPGLMPGLPAFKQILSMYRQGFPDVHTQIERLIAEEDIIVAHTMVQGIHAGTFLGHPATFKKFKAMAVDIFRFQQGKIAERWGVFDTILMLQQLGIYSPTG